MFYKLKTKLIKLLAGKNMTVLLNVKIDSKQGITFYNNIKYIVIDNLDVEGFEKEFYKL